MFKIVDILVEKSGESTRIICFSMSGNESLILSEKSFASLGAAMSLNFFSATPTSRKSLFSCHGRSIFVEEGRISVLGLQAPASVSLRHCNNHSIGQRIKVKIGAVLPLPLPLPMSLILRKRNVMS